MIDSMSIIAGPQVVLPSLTSSAVTTGKVRYPHHLLATENGNLRKYKT